MMGSDKRIGFRVLAGLQTPLEKLGASYASAGFMVARVVTDWRLVTGQNPVSAYGVAEAALGALAVAR